MKVCLWSHQYLPYTFKDNTLPIKNLEIQRVVIQRLSVILGYGYMQHTNMLLKWNPLFVITQV